MFLVAPERLLGMRKTGLAGIGLGPGRHAILRESLLPGRNHTAGQHQRNQ